jgi:hypothetical protein
MCELIRQLRELGAEQRNDFALVVHRNNNGQQPRPLPRHEPMVNNSAHWSSERYRN